MQDPRPTITILTRPTQDCIVPWFPFIHLKQSKYSHTCLTSCSCCRSHARRSEEEDDNSPHRFGQQQHLEIKAIVWASTAAYLFICVIIFLHCWSVAPSSIAIRWVYVLLWLWTSSDEVSLVARVRARTCTDSHLTPFYLNTGRRFHRRTGKNNSGLRLSLHREARVRVEKANVCVES